MSFELQSEALRRAYLEWAGEPFSVSSFRREDAAPSPLDALDVLCFQSSDEDCLRPENEFTFLATAGLSLNDSGGPVPHVELIWRVAGRRSWEEIQALAETLAAIAVLSLYEPAIFTPDAIIRDVSLPVFDRMNNLLVTNWGVYSPEYLPGMDPPVALLAIKALFGAEREIVAQIGAEEACDRFRTEGIDWDDPTRPCAKLSGEAAAGGAI